jgi:predicted TPR repeat methyltransferase
MSRFQSSGDIAADRRYLWAEASEKDGDFAAALDLYQQAAEAAPQWAAAWFGLARMLEKAGREEEARAAFGRCLALAPGDALGASVHLARLAGSGAGMPAAYVAGLFDQYAERFEAHLTGALQYRGPEVLRAALAEVRPPPYGAVLDLGCGTGLMAAALVGLAGHCDGIDLSAAMLAEAARRGQYRRLVQADVVAGTWSLAMTERYDLVLAADVLVYLGDLAALLQAVRAALAPGGLFGFTVQAGEGTGYRIGEDMRFHHSEAYLRAAAAAAGFGVARLAAASTRQDGGRDVAGLVAIFQARAG